MIKVFIKTTKKATLVVAFFVLATLNGYTKTNSRTESVSDIIEKAQTIGLQKKRQQALMLLLSSLKKEKKKNPQQKELISSMRELAFVFYTEKGQQIYELAMSLKQSNPTMALSKLNDAIKIEDNHLGIIGEIARIQILTGDCNQAYNEISKYNDLAVYINEILLIRAQAEICLSKLSNYQQSKSLLDNKNNPYHEAWLALDSEYYFKSGDFHKGAELISAERQSVKNPELHYWLWKNQLSLKNKPDKIAQKYLSSCKKLNTKTFMDFSIIPGVCSRVQEVENYMKKNNSEL